MYEHYKKNYNKQIPLSEYPDMIFSSKVGRKIIQAVVNQKQKDRQTLLYNTEIVKYNNDIAKLKSTLENQAVESEAIYSTFNTIKTRLGDNLIENANQLTKLASVTNSESKADNLFNTYDDKLLQLSEICKKIRQVKQVEQELFSVKPDFFNSSNYPKISRYNPI